MSKDFVLDWLELIENQVRDGCSYASLLGALRGLEEQLIWDMGRQQQFDAKAKIDAFLKARPVSAEKNRHPG
jgi:hypothetical protein